MSLDDGSNEEQLQFSLGKNLSVAFFINRSEKRFANHNTPVLPSHGNHLSRSWPFGAVEPPIFLKRYVWCRITIHDTLKNPAKYCRLHSQVTFPD